MVNIILINTIRTVFLLKFISILVCLSIFVFNTYSVSANENTHSNSKLSNIKENYIANSCFYQVTNKDYLDSLSDDEVIEVYQNIKITKKLLDQDLVLDINRVSYNDICINETAIESPQNDSRVFDTETRLSLSSSYNNVVVIKKATTNTGPYVGPSVNLAYVYLSNKGIKDFGYYSWVYEYKFGNTISETVGNMIAGTAVCYIPSTTFGAIFTIMTGAASLGNIIMTNNFRTSLNNLYESGKKAVVTITSTSQSCSEWSGNYFYIENASRNGLDISSTYRCYRDK